MNPEMSVITPSGDSREMVAAPLTPGGVTNCNVSPPASAPTSGACTPPTRTTSMREKSPPVSETRVPPLTGPDEGDTKSFDSAGNA